MGKQLFLFMNPYTKSILSTLLFLSIAASLHGQIAYSYDAAGNRIRRIADAPDIFLNLTIIPSAFTGTSAVNAQIRLRIFEANGIPTNGSLITARIGKNSVYSISLSPGTQVSGWTYQGISGVNHIFTSNLILNGNYVQINIPAVFYPNGSIANLPISASIMQGSGGELNTSNNSDQETISIYP